MWHEFWLNNNLYLTPSEKYPFLKNFRTMSDILSDHYCTSNWYGKDILEVGAGRGTISDLFHIRGNNTTCTDIVNTYCNQHKLIMHDILKDPPLTAMYDVVITYGLLEHFKTQDKSRILANCDSMLRHGGIAIHYVVPKKWTNMFEDSSVYRDNCKDLLSDEHQTVHVYPVFKHMQWQCGKFWSKGFIQWGIK